MSLFEPSPWADRVLAILRIVAAAVFITAGTMKLFAWPPSPQPMPPVPWMSQMGIGAMMEIVGGVLIILGLFTRPVAFVLSGEMAVAYFQFHYMLGKASFFPTINQGIPAILYCFLFLYMAFAGAGAWSIDRMIARGRSPAS